MNHTEKVGEGREGLIGKKKGFDLNRGKIKEENREIMIKIYMS